MNFIIRISEIIRFLRPFPPLQSGSRILSPYSGPRTTCNHINLCCHLKTDSVTSEPVMSLWSNSVHPIWGILQPSFSNSLLFLSVFIWASLVAQTLKSLPAMQETRIPSLGREDPLEKGMAAYSSCLEDSMDWEAWRATGHGLQRVGHDWVTFFGHFSSAAYYFYQFSFSHGQTD